jgi:TolB protein
MNRLPPGGLRGLAAIAMLCACANARAELTIEISRGAEREMPVAVVPFAAPGLAVDVAGVIAADLRSTGRFAPIPTRDMLQKPTTVAELRFEDWKMLGVEAVVVGRVNEISAGQYSVRFELLDVLRRQSLLAYQIPSDAPGLRFTAHRVADMIYEKLTGVAGVFATRIAYVTVTRRGPRNQVFRLWVADADGDGAQTLVESSEPIMSPSWSPDGRRLAYVSFENKQPEIFVQELRSGARRRVSARAGVNGAPAWSPDGRALALVLSHGDGNLDIYILDLSTQVLTRLTDHPSIETEPTWSPDGRTIYFTSDRGGGPQIYQIPANGGSAQRVTFEGNYNARARVSPDGRRLAVVHSERGSYRIGVIDLEHPALQMVTDGRLDESPSFAPNGETLIYATREGGRGALATVSVDGRVRQRISAVEGEVREPAWSPFRSN